MFRSLGVEADDVGTSFDKIRNDAVDRSHHQMDIDRYLDMRTDRLADQRPDRQVGNVMIVHHVEMDDVGTCGDDISYFFAQTGKVGG